MPKTNWKLLSSKEGGISTYQIDSFLDFTDFVNSSFQEYNKYIFRGQMHKGWKLQPSFDRIVPIDSSDYLLRRKEHLNQFIKYSQGRLKIEHSLSLKEEKDWWAIGQHYGLATPLLDWTESPFIAAYFAFAEESHFPKKDRIIYCLSSSYIEKYSDNKIELFYSQNDGNPRLINQRGLFTYNQEKIDIENHIKLNFPFKDNKSAMIKLIIPEKAMTRADFLKSLNRMNINHLTLFPDLSGASKYSNQILLIKNY